MRSEAQALASQENGSRSRGPLTEAGKSASSKNSLRHGLYARATLLPGEDVAKYEQHLEDYLQSFGPKNKVQADVVAEIADVAWKLRRLADIEQALLLQRLDQHLQESRLFRVRRHTNNCLTTARAVAEAIEQSEPRETVAETAPILNALIDFMGMLGELEDLAPNHLESLVAAEEKISDDGNKINPERYRGLVPVLRKIEEGLVDKLVGESEDLEELKKEAAKTELLLKKDDLTLLNKYRRYLEEANQRQLETLEKVKASSAEVDGALVEVALKVVK